MSYASELTSSMPGSDYILWEGSALNGIDFPVLRIRVAPPTPEPVTTVPATLVSHNPPDESDVSRTRYKAFSGTGMVGSGMFYINSLMFDPDVVNDTVLLGATEEWVVLNGSDIAHPFHIHGGSFYVLDRDGQPPHPWEEGPKDVVLVDMAEQVHLLMKFDELTEGWPFMYHCHNLMHEDNMMMLQYIVIDPGTNVDQDHATTDLIVFPSPANSSVSYHCDFPVREMMLTDMTGGIIVQERVSSNGQGIIDMRALAPGGYILRLRGGAREARTVVVRE
jgi:hypothetical protein